MRIVVTAALAVGFVLPALAEVSSDLLFCSKLSNQRERIACYDAAARGARIAPPSPRLIPTSVRPTPSPEDAMASKTAVRSPRAA